MRPTDPDYFALTVKLANIAAGEFIVTRRILLAGGEPRLYEPSTIRYWLAKGYAPGRIMREILDIQEVKTNLPE